MKPPDLKEHARLVKGKDDGSTRFLLVLLGMFVAGLVLWLVFG